MLKLSAANDEMSFINVSVAQETLQAEAVFTEAVGAGEEYGSFIKTRHPVNKTSIKGEPAHIKMLITIPLLGQAFLSSLSKQLKHDLIILNIRFPGGLSYYYFSIIIIYYDGLTLILVRLHISYIQIT